MNGEAKLQPDLENLPPKWPEWACNAQNQYGKKVTFSNGAASCKSDKTLLYDVKPELTSVLCEGKKVVLKRYPYSIGNYRASNAVNASLKDSLIEMGLTVASFLFEVPADPEIKTASLSFDFENQWKEQEKTSKCGWTFDTRLNASPLFSVKVGAGLKPKWLKKIETQINKWKIWKTLKLNKYFSITANLKGTVKIRYDLDAHYKQDEYGKHLIPQTSGTGTKSISGGGVIDFALKNPLKAKKLEIDPKDIFHLGSRLLLKGSGNTIITQTYGGNNIGLHIEDSVGKVFIEYFVILSVFGRDTYRYPSDGVGEIPITNGFKLLDKDFTLFSWK